MLLRCTPRLSSGARRAVISMSLLFDSLRTHGGVDVASWRPQRRHAVALASSRATDLCVEEEAYFAPLFSNEFQFEDHQLQFLGDAVVQNYLSKVLLEYGLARGGFIASSNAMRMVLAVFHNHFSMRLFGERLRFSDLAAPIGFNRADNGASCDAKNGKSDDDDLSFLVAEPKGPQYRELQGTSFAFVPLRCGQSAIGWKFSHLVGAVVRVYGVEAAEEMLESLYGLNGRSNLLGHAAQEFLVDLVNRYSPAPVAEALLSAQGIEFGFFGRSVLLDDSSDHDKTMAHTGVRSAAGTSTSQRAPPPSATPDDGELAEWSAATESRVVVTGFEVKAEAPLPTHVATRSVAAGPPMLDAVTQWRTREVEHCAVSGDGDKLLLKSIPSGWLSPSDRAREQRGPAFQGFVDFGSVSYFADVAGTPHPVPGQRVGRMPFVHPVRDENFHGAEEKKFRDGIPIDTEGKPLKAFLEQMNKPNKRQFEVSLVARKSTILGKAVATRYTLARQGACQGYLVAVAQDLRTIGNGSATTNSAAV